jgi:hypothetical protein
VDPHSSKELSAKQLQSYDSVEEIVPGKLWQSGNMASPSVALAIDVVVAVGESSQTWISEWIQKSIADSVEVINGNREHGPVKLPISVHAPLMDISGCLDQGAARLMAHFVAGLIQDGRRVLVHCDAGIARSSLLCALVLSLIEDISGSAALQRVWMLNGFSEKKKFRMEDFNRMIASWPPK